MDICEIASLGFQPSVQKSMDTLSKIAQERWDKIKDKEGWGKDDAVVYALEKLDDMGVDFDPTREQYQQIMNNVR